MSETNTTQPAPLAVAGPLAAAPVVVDLVVRDCGYGFSAHAVMSDGSRAFHATELHPTEDGALREVTKLIADAGRGG